MNSVQLIGRLTNDIDLRYTTNGTAVGNFTLAVDSRREDHTDFIQCVVWSEAAENMATHCRKGRQIAVIGHIQTRSWDDNDGKKRYATEVVVESSDWLAVPKEQEPQSPAPTSLHAPQSNNKPQPARQSSNKSSRR